MSRFIQAPLLVASLFAPEAPLKDKIEMLNNYFYPKIGTTISINLHDQNDKKRKKHPELSRGYITVTPPKGECFTITKKDSLPDVKVCHKKTVSYTMQDLRPDGTLHWIVSTGDNDFGTPIYWKSEHRTGKIVDRKMEWPGPSKDILIHSCEPVNNHRFGRRIYLTLFNGQKWVIALPKKDKYATKIPSKPRLYLSYEEERSGLQVEENPRYRVQAELLHKEAVIFTRKRRLKKGWAPTWSIYPRYALLMDSKNFMPFGDKTPGMTGQCRYAYLGHPTNKKDGSLECHETVNFKWVYIPLTCISDLRPDKIE